MLKKQRSFDTKDPISFVDGTFRGDVGLFQRYTDKMVSIYNSTKKRTVCVARKSIAPFQRIRNPRIPSNRKEAVDELRSEIIAACQDFKELGYSGDDKIVADMVRQVVRELDPDRNYGLYTLDDDSPNYVESSFEGE
jgi:hypothetical protein